MEIFFLTSLFILWIMLWSFSSVIIYRLKKAEDWMFTWRSHCSSCNTILKVLDLIPIFSWIFNKWKCRHCEAKVSSIYPVLEISTWILFSLVWYFLIDYHLVFWGSMLEISKLLFWLFIAFITIIYFFYDVLFLEISDIVLLIWIVWTVLAIVLQAFSFFHFFPNLPFWMENNFFPTIISIVILISAIIWLYVIIFKELKEIYDFLIIWAIISAIFLFGKFFAFNYQITEFIALNSLIWALSIFIFFFLQIVVSGWNWMWWWDLRIWILVWLMLWTSLSFPAMMLTYLVWSIIWIWIIVYQKYFKKVSKVETQIPFWPFIAAWFFLAMFFSDYINSLLNTYLFIN